MEWPRGKVLGGSSSINAMLYIRGNRLDYDTWRDAHGCTGWGYADLLPYFMTAEDNARGASDVPRRRWAAAGRGPAQSSTSCRQAFVESAVAHGIKRNDDFNGAGAGRRRALPGDPARRAVGGRPPTRTSDRRWTGRDLDLVTDALVTRVVDRGRSRGRRRVRRATASATVARRDGEVVLSGGAVNSPQLLLLSGVGPAPHLREHGIAVGRDLPGVGANLQDHLAAGALWRTRGHDEPARPREPSRRCCAGSCSERGPLDLTGRRGVRVRPDPAGPAGA